MNWQGWAEIALTLGLAVVIAWPLGLYMSRVWNGERTWLDPVLRPVEAVFYKAGGVDPARSQTWFGYAGALLAFTLSPMLASKLLKPAHSGGWLARRVDKAMDKLRDSYRHSLEGLLGRSSAGWATSSPPRTIRTAR